MAGKPSGRAALLLGAKVVISLALFAWLFQRVQWSNIVATIGRAHWEWLGGAFGLLILSNILGAYQWNRLMRAVGIQIPFLKVCSYYHVGLFFNNFLPANVGGDLARIFDATRSGTTRTAAFSTVLMDRMVGTVALAGLAVVTTLPAIDRFHLAAVYLGVLAFFTFAVTMLWAVFHPRLLHAITEVLERVGLGRFRPALEELSARLEGFRGQKRLFLELFMVATIVQIMRIFVHVLVARALNVHVPVAYFFLFVPLLAVIVSLPISLNGIGVREGVGILLFGMVGLDRGSAFSLQFTTYLVAVAVSLIGGILFLVRIPHRRAAAQSSRRTTG
ncbi:MAG: lysylphosphatidylglycerol synthase transmembrane domain-containing protein [Candidatus Eisenbacteria bacterium]